MNTIKQDFFENLALTQKYIEKYKLSENRTTDLRTLNFKIDNQYLFNFEQCETTNPKETFLVAKWKNDPIRKKNTVKKVFEIQIQLKKEKLLGNHQVKNSGKILISNYNDTLWEGYCEVVTKGFTDEHDLLPIDTWFYLENGLLYSWIPDEYIEIASDCIWASSTDIFNWNEKEISEILNFKEETTINKMKTEKEKITKKKNFFKKWFDKN